ncbi:alpha-ribazole phosphatase family protein [Uliginosibacterium sp. H3]|uniref:Alpha-ribazole phosphatase family protein n=1 Tax=Uliginosibacterium silvisoli TaxID=3114758 RepID=A0ABU6JXZ8_9RHOO|nr:alpha-ribazole phosphatase family protein [Uliginosibacterium sp. H3]
MSRKIYLVRHAAVAVPAGVCYGRSDVALSGPVMPYASWLAAVLPQQLPVFASPLSRCLLLAQALATSPVIDPRLAEMDFGEWEMRRFDDIPRQQLDAWGADPLGFRAPGGESGNEVFARVLAALRDILDGGRDAIIVSHGGPLRAIRGSLLGLPREAWLGQVLAQGSLSVLREEGGRWLAEGVQCFDARFDVKS